MFFERGEREDYAAPRLASSTNYPTKHKKERRLPRNFLVEKKCSFFVVQK